MGDRIDLGPYNRFIRRTAQYVEYGEGTPMEISYLGLGVAGEAGELADVIKKVIRRGQEHYHPSLSASHDKIINEMGDVFWYLFQLMRFMDVDLETVLEANTVKLQKRYEDGTVAALVHKD